MTIRSSHWHPSSLQKHRTRRPIICCPGQFILQILEISMERMYNPASVAKMNPFLKMNTTLHRIP